MYISLITSHFPPHINQKLWYKMYSTDLISTSMPDLWSLMSLYGLEPISHHLLASILHKVLHIVPARDKHLTSAGEPLVTGGFGTRTISKSIRVAGFLHILQKSTNGIRTGYRSFLVTEDTISETS